MANRYAVVNGNWSNTATWDGGTLPTAADDVYSNNFNVNIDQNIDVISLRNTATTGITAGGTFTFNTGGVTANISNTIIMNPTVSTSFILITASSGLVTMNIPNGSVIGTDVNNSNLINYTGNCDFTMTCISVIGALTASNNLSSVISKTSTGILIFNGNVIGRTGGTGFFRGTLNLTSNSDNTVNGNITGGAGIGVNGLPLYITLGNLTVTGNITGGTGNQSHGIYSITNGIINVTGNLTGGINTSRAIEITAGNLNVTGIITGGTTNGSVGVAISGTGILNHIGIAQASTFGSAITCNTPTTSIITCTGPFLRNGYTVAVASQTLRINSLFNPYFEFRTSDATDVTYVDESTLNFPTESNVRQGTTYASGLYTGTLIVPNPSNVRKDIPTDNTVGTADLTAADFWNYATSNLTDPNGIGARLKNVSTVDTTGEQLEALL